jgi:tryptophan halogenase
MKINLNNISIIGGGTSGWLTALHLNSKLKNSRITLIESNEIGILGAGEGTTGNIVRFLHRLGIKPNDLIENCEATFKEGIDFINWTDNDKSFFHPINFIKSDKYLNYSFHINARLFASYLKKIAIERGVIWKEGIVNEPIVNDENEIIGVKIEDGSIIESDFVFDCTGFRRLLIGKYYNSKWISYEKYLKLNSAIPFFLPNNNPKLYTKTDSIALKNGWMWQIPLQSRKGCGYIFDINEITEQEAKQEVIDFLGYDPQFNKLIKFEPGTYEKVWIKNCLSIGLSGGFIEPLEATSIMTQILQLELFEEVVINNKISIEQYNNFINQINTHNMIFIYYHYFGKKESSNFWKKIKKVTNDVPHPLNDIIDKNNDVIKNLDLNEIFDFVTFSLDSWNIINKGIKNKVKILI